VYWGEHELLVLPVTATAQSVARKLTKRFLLEPLDLLTHQRVVTEEWTDYDWVSRVRRAFLLYWSMGSGKTAAVLGILAHAPAPRVLIVCSNTLIGYWVDWVAKMPQTHDQTIFWIVGYNEFRRMAAETPQVTARWVVVVDECHWYRNMTPAMRTDIIALKKAQSMLLLTGTPIQNDVSEMEGFLTLMGVNVTQITDWDDGPTIACAVHPLLEGKVSFYDPSIYEAHRFHLNYPHVTVVKEKVPMVPDQTLEYLMSMRKDTRIGGYKISTARRNSYDALTRALSNTHDPENPETSPKFSRVVENLKTYPGPHVVYSHFRPKGVEAIVKLVSALYPNVALVTGSIEGSRRDRVIEAYNQKKIDVLFITDAAREGIDLKGTGTMHILEPHRNLLSERQTLARVARYDSHAECATKTVTVVKYVSIFPNLDPKDQCTQHVLRTYFEGTYDLEANFDIVKEVQRLIRATNGTVDEEYEKTNLTKEREVRPCMEMLQEVGDMREKMNCLREKQQKIDTERIKRTTDLEQKKRKRNVDQCAKTKKSKC
jgi:superfamily II DNA or RNA helicase